MRMARGAVVTLFVATVLLLGGCAAAPSVTTEGAEQEAAQGEGATGKEPSAVSGAGGVQEDTGFTWTSSEEARQLCTFTLCGVEYELPCSIEDFFANGWSKDESFSYSFEKGVDAFTKVAGGPYLVDGSTGFTEGDEGFKPFIRNHTDSTLEWNRCTVYHVAVSNRHSHAAIADSFTTSKGLSIGDDVRKAVELYGEPSSQSPHSDGSVATMVWNVPHFGDDGDRAGYVALSIGCDEQGLIDIIKIGF